MKQFVLLLLVFGYSIIGLTQDAEDGFWHIVQPDESLLSISYQYDICWEFLVGPYSSDITITEVTGSLIETMDKIFIPEIEDLDSCYNGVYPRIHAVQRGETLHSIAADYEICLRDLMRRNAFRLQNMNIDYLPPEFILTIAPYYGNQTPCDVSQYNETIAYVVKEGDTLSGISVQYDVCPYDIMQVTSHHSIMNFDDIVPGHVINIPLNIPSCYNPPENQPLPVAEGDIVYKPLGNDTLTTIAHCYGTSIDALIKKNKIPNPDLLGFYYTQYGLIIPEQTHDCYMQDGERYSDPMGDVIFVQPGETIHDLAFHYGVPMQWIIDHNHIENSDHIFIGQRLVIPNTVNLWILLKITTFVTTLFLITTGLVRTYRYTTQGRKQKRKHEPIA